MNSYQKIRSLILARTVLISLSEYPCFFLLSSIMSLFGFYMTIESILVMSSTLSDR